MATTENIDIMINNKKVDDIMELLKNNDIRFKRISSSKILISSIEFFPQEILDRGVRSVQNKLISFLLQKCPDLIKLIDLFSSRNVPEDAVEDDGETKAQEVETKAQVTNNPIVNNLERFRNKKIVVKGFVQSGKTNFIISASALFNLVGKKNIVIIIRNSTDDELQLKTRMQHFNNEIKELTESSGDFLANSRNIFIEIGNSTRMKKLSDKLKRSRKEYVLFVDEVDFMDSVDTKTTEELSKLKLNSYCTFGISATVMDPILKEEDTNLIILSKPENYRGIESFQTKVLTNKNSVLTKKISDPIADDLNLDGYLRSFATRDPYFVPIYNDYHPVDTLIRVSLALDPNRRLLSYIANQYPTIPCMFYSGGGSIELYLQNVTTPIQLADGSKSKIKKLQVENKLEELYGLYHFFNSTSPSYVKQWLYENGGVTVYPRIITIAGSLASRCISYGASNFEQCKTENKLWWHLTEMYLCASSTMDQPELIQTAGRLCVSTPRGDNVPLTLYATKEVEKDLVKAYWLQEELIDRANTEREFSDNPMWKLIEDTPIYKGKIPSKKRSMTKKVEYDLNKISSKDDGGYDVKEYRFENELNIEEEQKPKETSREKIGQTRDLDYTEKTRRWIRNVLRKGETLISIFLNQIDIEAIYTKDELIVLLGNSGFQQPRSFISSLISISKYGSYCIFEKVDENRWKIFEDLKMAWS